MKKYKPIEITDNFGDKTLSCGFCKEPIYFPLFKKYNGLLPTKCACCGKPIDWST